MRLETELRTPGRRIAAAVIVGILFAGLILLACMGEGILPIYLVIAVLLGVGACAWCLLPIRLGRILSGLLMILIPAAAVCAIEFYTHVPQDLSLKIFIMNLLFYFILYGLFSFLTGRTSLGYVLATLIPMIFGLVNYYVVQFRGHPIVPWDFLSLQTAMSVASNYSPQMTWKVAFALIGFLWIILISARLVGKFPLRLPRILGIGLAAAGMVLFLVELQHPDVQSYFGMDTTLFTLNVLYRNNGIVGGFLGNLRFLKLDEPDGYSREKVEEINQQVEDSRKKTVTRKNKPNIILIMNEAFSDLSVYGELNTSEEVMPFFRQMQEEGTGGEVYVSVKGGNTANTEYELLTGDTTAFLPAGSVAYQQYIHEEMPSLPSYLKNLGYQTLAIHPYRRAGWDRERVYECFGFDKFLDQTDFSNPIRYRGYVSDLSAFEKIIEEYENRDPEKPFFAFEVTMQNHGGYSRDNPDFDSYVKLTDVENKTVSVHATEKYLTLMNLTDRALQELVLYFENVKEPTIIMMLGDHQPSDYITNVVRRLTGNSAKDTLDDLELGYRVPFVIWSNKYMKHEWIDKISVNYLGGLLMEKAKLPLTAYQLWLKELEQEYPVINANAFMDADGTFYQYQADTDLEGLNTYQILQYNHLFDQKNRVNTFFEGESTS